MELSSGAVTEEEVAASGVKYCIETEAFIEDGRSGHLRVLVSIDDGGLSAVVPLSDDFIVAPDGSFIGE